MALSGTFSSMSPSDLLQMLSWGAKTGLLTCHRGDERRHVFLADGDVVGVTSSRYKDRLGAMLLRVGCINEEQFNDVFSRQASNGRPLGEIFISENLLEEEELQSILTLQAEEIIFDLVSWDNGDFSFEERKLDNEEDRLNPVVISNLLLEGARRMDEIRRIRSFINDKDMVFKLKSGNSVGDTNFSRPENVITNLLISPMSLGDIFKLVNETEYSILTALCSLLDKEM
ncbi:DUF4388 domain-containing protein, partial [bacterium]|nr:DUF4388 domain-containing protein [bacterium]